MNGDVGGVQYRQTDACEWQGDIKMFKAHYGCLDCLYKGQYKTCYGMKVCKVVDNPEIDNEATPDAGECEDCPYGNAAGTCFGFCIRAILTEYRNKLKAFRLEE